MANGKPETEADRKARFARAAANMPRQHTSVVERLAALKGKTPDQFDIPRHTAAAAPKPAAKPAAPQNTDYNAETSILTITGPAKCQDVSAAFGMPYTLIEYKGTLYEFNGSAQDAGKQGAAGIQALIVGADRLAEIKTALKAAQNGNGAHHPPSPEA